MAFDAGTVRMKLIPHEAYYAAFPVIEAAREAEESGLAAEAAAHWRAAALILIGEEHWDAIREMGKP